MIKSGKDDKSSQQFSVKVPNLNENMGSGFIIRNLTLKKSHKTFCTEYIPDVRNIP